MCVLYRDKQLKWPRVKYDLTTPVSAHAHQLVPWLTHEVIRPTVSIATAGSTDHEVVYVNQKLTAFASDPKQVYVAVSRAKGCTHVIMCIRTAAASFPAQQLGHLAHLCYYMGWCSPGDKKASVSPTIRLERDGNEFDCVDGLFNPSVLL